MRIAYWFSVLALAASATVHAQASVALPDGGRVSYAAAGAKTRFEIHAHAGRPYVLTVGRDATVPTLAAPTKVEVLGSVKGVAFILADTYASRPGGLSYCQAGEERFLRVISIIRRPARETLRIKLESCRETIELATPGMAWEPERASLQLNWLQGPQAGGGPQTRTIKINAEGKPE
ncbi:MAG: hypothetical protein WCI11_13315 [Candidatus Methylumidiphilus sp.]